MGRQEGDLRAWRHWEVEVFHSSPPLNKTKTERKIIFYFLHISVCAEALLPCRGARNSGGRRQKAGEMGGPQRFPFSGLEGERAESGTNAVVPSVQHIREPPAHGWESDMGVPQAGRAQPGGSTGLIPVRALRVQRG